MFEKTLQCGRARYLRSFEAVSEHERQPLGVSTLLCVFHENFLSIFLKIARFEPEVWRRL